MKFGPAGNSDSFKGKSILDVPLYLSGLGLDTYEYQAGRGVKIGKDSATNFGKKASEHNISLSIHAPYYISLSSEEEAKRVASVDYIMQSAKAISYMGGDRVIIHAGSASKMSREEAIKLAGETLEKATIAVDNEGLNDIWLCPELMGKINQLGNLEEIIELCKNNERLLPCIDFGHLNSRTGGSLLDTSAFRDVFNKLKNGIGAERLNLLHIHFSKIEYTTKGGEKKHLTFEDEVYGPDYRLMCDMLFEFGVKEGRVICESAGTQAEDARTMKQYFQTLK